MMKMSAAEFRFIAEAVRERSGMVLEEGKEYLVETRVKEVLQRLRIESFAELVQRMQKSQFDPAYDAVVEGLTVNETAFYRDGAPFDALREIVLPELIEARRNERRLSIWCAASSSGQEPYSVCMMIRDHFPDLLDWRIDFVATDYSKEMVDRCRRGEYNLVEIGRGMPPDQLGRYFNKQDGIYTISPAIRKMVDFRMMNLVGPWPFGHDFDLIMIRNVLIYFDLETKKNILQKACKLLRPDGFLQFGAAESPIGLDVDLVSVPFPRGGTYRLHPTTV